LVVCWEESSSKLGPSSPPSYTPLHGASPSMDRSTKITNLNRNQTNMQSLGILPGLLSFQHHRIYILHHLLYIGLFHWYQRSRNCGSCRLDICLPQCINGHHPDHSMLHLLSNPFKIKRGKNRISKSAIIILAVLWTVVIT